MLGHNREDFWEIPENLIGKILSAIDAGLFLRFNPFHAFFLY